MEKKSLDVLFHIYSEYFREPLTVWVAWDFPYMPRTGEYVNGWIWIESKHFDLALAENLLTEEGKALRKKEGLEMKDFLYEISISKNRIESLCYYKNDRGGFDIHLHINEYEGCF